MADETRLETKPIRLTWCQWFCCWLRVLSVLPAITRAVWRDAWIDWRQSRVLLAIVRRARAGQGVGGSGEDITAQAVQDSNFMLLVAGQAAEHFKLVGRGALQVYFSREAAGPVTFKYFPLGLLERVGFSDEIVNAVREYDPVSEAVILLQDGEGMKVVSVGVGRIGRGGA